VECLAAQDEPPWIAMSTEDEVTEEMGNSHSAPTAGETQHLLEPSSPGPGSPGSVALGVQDEGPPVREVLLGRQPMLPAKGYCEGSRKGKPFVSNAIRTTKYSPWSFLPKFLYEQFTKVANVYFICMVMLQLFPYTTISNGLPTVMVPLLFVLFVACVKELLEDFARHRADKETNERMVGIVRSGLCSPERWDQVEVGDLVEVADGQSFPADVVLLASSSPQGAGSCWVGTKELDGESNLKAMNAADTTSRLTQQMVKANFGSEEGRSTTSWHDVKAKVENVRLASQKDLTIGQYLHDLGVRVSVEPPNRELDRVEGSSICLEGKGGVDGHGEGAREALRLCHLALRGSRLRDTGKVWGLVVYTGEETKIMKNKSATPSKRSSVDLQTDHLLLYLLCTQACLALASAGVAAYYESRETENRTWYLGSEAQGLRLDIFARPFMFILIYMYLIPIALYVSLEMVRFVQAQFMSWDIRMYDDETDSACLVRTSSLNEELGRVSYVFSDKTGTLTANVMQFREAFVGGKFFADPHDPAQPRTPNVELDPAAICDMLYGSGSQDEELVESLRHYIVCMSCCHTVQLSNAQGSSNHPVYSAQSPDELALVYMAQACGAVFTGRSSTELHLNLREAESSSDITIPLMATIEFDSARKRMSVLCKINGEFRVYVKGADNIILERLQADDPMRNGAIEAVDTFSKKGLRTLLLATRVVSKEQAERWSKQIFAASTDEAIQEVASEIEVDLTLLGATAVEDKLQDGVPNTLITLARMNVKTWVLTGDKKETAIAIGFSAGLLSLDMYIIAEHISPPEMQNYEDKRAAAERFLQAKLDQIKQTREREARDLGSMEPHKYGLVVDGPDLKIILEHPESPLAARFFELATQCTSVIIARATPLQKAEVVNVVRNADPQAITLAIGDGANDTGMIQQAHVGVGLRGKEGSQAVNTSDYAIGQFRFLLELMLVQGRYNYHRQITLVLFMFYKCFVVVIPIFLFQTQSRFSAQECYEFPAYQFYNTLFTSIPIILMGIWDVDFSREIVQKHPDLLYAQSQEMRDFTMRRFVVVVLFAMYQSLVIFILTTQLEQMREASVYTIGFYMFTAVVLTVNVVIFYVYLRLRWSIWSALCFIVSVGSYVSFELLLDSNLFLDLGQLGKYVGTAWDALPNTALWLMSFVAVALGLMPLVIKASFDFMFYPDAYITVLETERHSIEAENAQIFSPGTSRARRTDPQAALALAETLKAEEEDAAQHMHTEQLARRSAFYEPVSSVGWRGTTWDPPAMTTPGTVDPLSQTCPALHYSTSRRDQVSVHDC